MIFFTTSQMPDMTFSSPKKEVVSKTAVAQPLRRWCPVSSKQNLDILIESVTSFQQLTVGGNAPKKQQCTSKESEEDQ